MLSTDTPILNKAIKRQQTMLDYTCQFAGNLESLFDTALLNGVSITQDMVPGTLLKAPQVDLKVIRFYDRVSGEEKERDIITNVQAQPVQGGIGFMQIGSTFKVS